MSSTTTVIVFIVALILSVGFLMLVLSLVPAINQLKSLLTDLEKTSVEARNLTIQLKAVSEKVDKDVEKFDAILDASKETMETVSSSVKLINKSVIKKSAGFLAFLPAIKFGWDLVKKIKGGKKNV
jgi:predicted PurR-regulated permease PerM